MTSALYEIETSEGDDGTMHPAEQIWTPCADGAADHGFIAHQGLFVAGIDGGADDDLYPVGFLVLGHQRWADIIEAAAAYMARTHGWRNLQNRMNCIECNIPHVAATLDTAGRSW